MVVPVQRITEYKASYSSDKSTWLEIVLSSLLCKKTGRIQNLFETKIPDSFLYWLWIYLTSRVWPWFHIDFIIWEKNWFFNLNIRLLQLNDLCLRRATFNRPKHRQRTQRAADRREAAAAAAVDLCLSPTTCDEVSPVHEAHGAAAAACLLAICRWAHPSRLETRRTSSRVDRGPAAAAAVAERLVAAQQTAPVLSRYRETRGLGWFKWAKNRGRKSCVSVPLSNFFEQYLQFKFLKNSLI